MSTSDLLASTAEEPIAVTTPKRKRASIRALRQELADAKAAQAYERDRVVSLRTRRSELHVRVDELEDKLLSANDEKDTQARTLESTRTALEFVISTISLDKSPADFIAFCEAKSKEYGFDLRSFNVELQEAANKAYAKAPARAANASNGKRTGDLMGGLLKGLGGDRDKSRVRRPGDLSSILGGDPLSALMSLIGDGPGGDLSLGIGGSGAGDILANEAKQDHGDPRDTDEKYFHPFPSCTGHSRTK